MKPVAKSAGGKTRLLPEILKHVPERIGTYAEPFAGGAALFFYLASESPRRFSSAVLADTNPDLIAFYRAVRDDVGGLIECLRGYRNESEFFLRTRKASVEGMSDAERGARFLYLNKTCFNGLWRANKKGEFNTPWAGYEKPRFCDEVALRAASLALRGVRILETDFEGSVGLREGDFVYLDPPYAPISATSSFTSYGKGGFGPEDQARLGRWVRRAGEWGVKCLLSNSDVPETRAIYEGLPVTSVRGPRSIAANGTRADAGEILVRNWGDP